MLGLEFIERQNLAYRAMQWAIYQQNVLKAGPWLPVLERVQYFT